MILSVRYIMVALLAKVAVLCCTKAIADSFWSNWKGDTDFLLEVEFELLLLITVGDY